MHPFDSSLDTSFHKHMGPQDPRRKQTRRTSLDNGCFSDKSELMSLDGSSHGTRSMLPRRRSLNTEMVIPTTFLASVVRGSSTKPDSDLDLDCHTWVDEASERAGPSLHSSHHHMKPIAMEVTDDEQEGSASSAFDENEDSFCEASYAAPANEQYMRQDLGVSCFLDDDLLDDIGAIDTTELAAFEALENDEHEATERGGDQLEGDFTASDDCGSFCDANDGELANRDYLVKDLGASCFWASSDHIFLPEDSGEPTIETIAEE